MGLRTRRNPNNHHFHSSNRYGEGVALSTISSYWMVDQFIAEPKELDYLAYEEQATARYEELIEGFSNDNITSMDYARNLGVEREWQTYQFFASEEINAPDEVMVYVNDLGEVVPFSKEEIELISNWQKGQPAPIEGIEGHHMELVRDNPNNIELAASPDNILFATSTGHRDFLHEGHTHNPTAQEYFPYSLTTDEQFELTLAHNQELLTLSMLETGMWTVGGAMVLYASIRSLVEWYRMKDSLIPWERKRAQILKTGMATALVGGGLASVGFVTAASMEGIFADMAPGMLEQFFTEMLAINGAFFAVVATGGLLRYAWERKMGKDAEQAMQDYKQIMMTATAEFLAFSALGLGLDVLASAATDTVMDALIPDPTGILIGARVAYSLLKLGKKAWDSNENKKALQMCTAIRMDYLSQCKLP